MDRNREATEAAEFDRDGTNVCCRAAQQSPHYAVAEKKKPINLNHKADGKRKSGTTTRRFDSWNAFRTSSPRHLSGPKDELFRDRSSAPDTPGVLPRRWLLEEAESVLASIAVQDTK
jgi:hypothetical protein